jgi:hypothetical protein
MIEAAGRPPVLVPSERARYSREHVGSDYIGWLARAKSARFESVRDSQPA